MNRLKGLSPNVKKTNRGYLIDGYNKDLDIDIVIKNYRMWIYSKDGNLEEVHMNEQEKITLSSIINKYNLSRSLVAMAKRDIESFKDKIDFIKSALKKDFSFQEDAIIEIEKMIEDLK